MQGPPHVIYAQVKFGWAKGDKVETLYVLHFPAVISLTYPSQRISSSFHRKINARSGLEPGLGRAECCSRACRYWTVD